MQLNSFTKLSQFYDKVASFGPFVLLNYSQAGISLVISIFLANALGAIEFGIYSYGLVFATGLPLVVGFAEDRTLVRDLVHSRNASAVLSASILTRLILSAMAIGGIVLWINWYSQPSSWTILCCSICGVLAGMSPRAWFDFQYQMTKHAVITFCERFLFSILLLLVIFGPSVYKNAITVSVLLLTSAMLSIFSQWVYVYKGFKFEKNGIFLNSKLLLKENYLIWLAIMGNLLMTHANRIILTEKSGATEMAFYGLALQFVMVIQILQVQILRILSPKIANLTNGIYKSRVVRKKLFKYVGLSFGLTGIIIIPIFFFVPFIVKNFMNAAFLDVIPTFYILLIWILFYGAAIITNQFLLCLRLNQSYIITTLIFGIISVMLANKLIPLYGSVGAAISLLVAHSGSIITQFILVCLKLREPCKLENSVNN